MCPKLSMLFLALLAEVENAPFQYGRAFGSKLEALRLRENPQTRQ